MLAEGMLIARKFRLDRVLGKGGMGLVVAATHVQLNQRVAIKLLSAEDATNPHVVERFTREARAAAALRGENVCRVSDVGALDDGTPYIVMELLEGTDLSRMLNSRGPLSVTVACRYVLQACAGVGEAHAMGIVHRDLKPANLFVARRPDGTSIVKVLDFGIAKAPDAGGDFSLTGTSVVLGSPGYMSPEQLKSSRDVDHRTDIWSLGVILYELITGKRPFAALSITELAIRVAIDPRPAFVSAVPPGFDHVIDRCLAKEPADRYPDLAHLAHALAPFAGPDGLELAGAVGRMLRVTPVAVLDGPTLITGAVPPTVGEVPETVLPTGYSAPRSHPGPPSHTPQVAPAMRSAVAPAPATTLGASAISRETQATPAAPRGSSLAIRLGIAAIAAAVPLLVFFVVSNDDGGRGSGEEPRIVAPPRGTSDVREPAVVVDAAVAPVVAADAAEVALDAEVSAAPADAVVEPAPVDAAVPVKTKVKTKVKPRPVIKRKDYGELRD